MIIKTMSSLSFFQKSAVSPLASSRVFALFPRGGSSSRLFHNNSFFFFFSVYRYLAENSHTFFPEKVYYNSLL